MWDSQFIFLLIPPTTSYETKSFFCAMFPYLAFLSTIKDPTRFLDNKNKQVYNRSFSIKSIIILLCYLPIQNPAYVQYIFLNFNIFECYFYTFREINHE